MSLLSWGKPLERPRLASFGPSYATVTGFAGDMFLPMTLRFLRATPRETGFASLGPSYDGKLQCNWCDRRTETKVDAIERRSSEACPAGKLNFTIPRLWDR
jgi:hypothetical protein